MNARLALGGAVAAAGVVLAAPAAAPAALATIDLSSPVAKARKCHERLVTPGGSVRQAKVTADKTGLVTVRMNGGGDWDLAVFSLTTRRLLAGAATPTSAEFAEGFVAQGEQLVVQACRYGGDDRPARAIVDTVGLGLKAPGPDEKYSLVEVDTPTVADRQRLMSLGFDDSHKVTKTTLGVLAHGARDLLKLTAAGFTYTVKVPDLLERDRERVREDRAFAAKTERSALPSGRDSYRHLADYEAEMKLLAQQNPNLVKLITLKHKSLQGRDILGLEIAQNVNLADGRPVFANMAMHHAREWPSSEHSMEWAYELIRGFGKDPRVTKLVENTRTIVVPVVNPDGFNLSREAPVDLGGPLAAIDLPPQVDNPDVLPITDPTYTSALLLDQTAGTFAYKRRNCRVKDGEVPKEGECENPDNRMFGVDPNRNYGALWGGPGASLDPTSDTYRGAGPFSEPETQNIQDLVSRNHVTTLITNHTFSNLILRPPGVKSQGAPPDEDALKALGDAMAGQNGYASLPGYGLYDTTGTTEDWSYNATGGYGYTFEIGPDEFHPPYEEMIAEYEGAGQYAGKGNRAAYFLAQENTLAAAQHSVLTGTAPAGSTLRLHKEFETETSPVIQDDTGATGPVQRFKDVLDTTLEVGSTGKFEWHVNPSTRPGMLRDKVTSDVNDAPASELDISSPLPPLPGVPNLTEFEVKPDNARQIRVTTTGTVPVDDIDIYLYEGSKAPENQVSSSAGGTADETLVYDNPKPGKYVLEVRNFAAVGPYDGKIAVFGEKAGTRSVRKATTESYTFTCERPAGKVLVTRKVEVKRGQRLGLGRACSTNEALDGGSTGSGKLRVDVAADRPRLARALSRGLRVRVRCNLRCRASIAVLVDGRTAKRVGLTKQARRMVVARGTIRSLKGRRFVRLRFTTAARKRLRGQRNVRFVVTAVASQQGASKTKARKSRSIRLK